MVARKAQVDKAVRARRSREELKHLKSVAEVADIEQVGLNQYTDDAMLEYGKETLQQRAVVDFRDGLKPVHRRIIWSAKELNLRANHKVVMKAARIVGDTMGKYHPHGDTSIYGALVGMVHQAHGPIHGSGNYGTLLRMPAAMRYTEARLSDYGDRNFLDYVNVVEMIQNYDGKLREPLILPSALPNLLLNGTFGIATGATCSIPAFEAEGVIHLTRLALQSRPITIRQCMRYLKPVEPEGGIAWMEDTPEYNYTGELRRFFETGLGSLYWSPAHERNVATRSVEIWGWVPSAAVNLETSLAKAMDLTWKDDKNNPQAVVGRSEDLSDIKGSKTKYRYRFHLARWIPAEEVEAALLAIVGKFEGSQRLVFNVNQRDRSEADPDESDVSFTLMTMPDFFRRWATYRVELERSQVGYEMGVAEAKLERDELLLLIANNLDTYTAALKRDDTVAYLSTKLKITQEQANAALEYTGRRLMKLEVDKLKTAITAGKALIKRLDGEHREPAARTLAAIDSIAKLVLA